MWNIRNYSQSEIALQTIEMIYCIKIDFECKTFGLGRKSTTQLELTIFSGVKRESIDGHLFQIGKGTLK